MNWLKKTFGNRNCDYETRKKRHWSNWRASDSISIPKLIPLTSHRSIPRAPALLKHPIARRIAALILLQPELDANYQMVKSDTCDWPEK